MAKTLPLLRSNPFLQFQMQSLCCLSPREILSWKFDFNVYLPSRGLNLQREFVWGELQKEGFIESILIGRPIPPVYILFNNDDINEVIDGKQRLTTILSFLKNEFRYCGYFYKEMPIEYANAFKRNYMTYCRIVPDCEEQVTDEQKIELFYFLNFAGTPQERFHLNKLLLK